jgi:hypothetical protein
MRANIPLAGIPVRITGLMIKVKYNVPSVSGFHSPGIRHEIRGPGESFFATGREIIS